MSIQRKVLGAAATLALLGGISTAGSTSARAAAPQCGQGCIEVFSPRFGSPTQPNFIESVRHGVAQVGQPAILAGANSTNAAGDFLPLRPGTGLVSDFFAAGMVSAAVDSHYGSLPAVQLEYAPFGKATGLCSAVAKTAFDNEGLSLQPCTVPGTAGVDHRSRGGPSLGGGILRHHQRLHHGLLPPVLHDLPAQAAGPHPPRPSAACHRRHRAPHPALGRVTLGPVN